ncbi:ATP-binding protein [Paralcaligenes sp. KSB-10]|uniref:sensor histidine kinase n=1 Tax=Paralcaligenes sp. KSB-10 TaxID=2901142 RepID=UPI001E443903|nr:ATP-binding protein [Paralcaligenes sp. KSB-10]UHL65653.1 ATP-binding protein [Paralcaligenes sp. KSB-10]
MRYLFARRRLSIYLLLAACVGIAYIADCIVFAQETKSTLAQAHQRAVFYSLSLESTLARYESLPKVISFEKKMSVLLDNPGDAVAQQAANQYLRAVQVTTGSRVAYLIDADGLTLASSNWDKPDTFVGQNYTFRPYFRDALQFGQGRFYGLGTTSHEAGYFLATSIRTQAGTRGVIVVKISLSEFESALSQSSDTVMLLDSGGIIFLSSVPAWRYHTLVALSAQKRAAVNRNRQYGKNPLDPLEGVVLDNTLPQTLDLALPGQPKRTLLTEYVPVGPLGWKLAIFVDPQRDRQLSRVVGIGVGFVAAFVAALFMVRNQQRKRYEERRRAKNELDQAHAELETRIALRTTDLTEKIAALDRAQHILRETRDSAVQAGKLAVLGQMAAGITHELSQPLTALTTLSDNTVHLVKRGELEEVSKNVFLISKLAARMGNIVSSIKAFSRKDNVGREPVNVSNSIHQALMLVEPRRKQVAAKVQLVRTSSEALAWGNSIRLEQVLVNLLRNGLDAAADQPGSVLSVTVQVQEKHVHIIVRDQGPGISDAVRQHLFEPFFTTKPTGQGIGLGLAISLAIIEEMRGQLQIGNAPDRGTEATIILEHV